MSIEAQGDASGRFNIGEIAATFPEPS